MNKTGTVFTLDTRDLSTFNSKLSWTVDIEEPKKVSVDDVNNFIDKVKSGEWIWWKNSSCKYIKVFTYGDGIYLFNRDNKSITLEDLEFQHE